MPSWRTRASAQAAGVAPNVRTVSTVLRGCVRSGRTDIVPLIARRAAAAGVAMDATCLGYIARARCGALDAAGGSAAVADLLDAVGERRAAGAASGACAAALCELAQARALAGDLKGARGALTRASGLLRAGEAAAAAAADSGAVDAAGAAMDLDGDPGARRAAAAAADGELCHHLLSACARAQVMVPAAAAAARQCRSS